MVYLLLEKLDDAVAKLYVLASGLHSVLRRVGVVHQCLWLDCGYTLMRQSMEVGRPENTFEMELFTFRLHLQSRSSNFVRTFRDQCRSTQDSLSSQELTFLLVLAFLDEGHALDGHSLHPPGEQSSLWFRRLHDTRVHGRETPFSTPLC